MNRAVRIFETEDGATVKVWTTDTGSYRYTVSAPGRFFGSIGTGPDADEVLAAGLAAAREEENR